MDEQIKLKTRIAEKLTKYSSTMIRREKPFSNIPLYPQFMSSALRVYYESGHNFNKKEKNDFIEAEIAFACYRIRTYLKLSGGKSFDVMFPEHYRTWNNFRTRLSGKSVSFLDNFNNDDKKIKVFPIIKRIMKNRMPEFSSIKNRADRNELSFSKKLSSKKNMFILFDKGTHRKFISVHFGIDNPSFVFDVSTFLSGTQSRINYRSEDELISELNIAIDYVRLVLPYFINAVLDEKYGGEDSDCGGVGGGVGDDRK